MKYSHKIQNKHTQVQKVYIVKNILLIGRVSTTPHYSFWPLRAWISGFKNTFSWLDDVLLAHVHGIIILLPQLIIIWPKSHWGVFDIVAVGSTVKIHQNAHYLTGCLTRILAKLVHIVIRTFTCFIARNMGKTPATTCLGFGKVHCHTCSVLQASTFAQ